MKSLFKGWKWWFVMLIPGTLISFLANPPIWGLAWIVPTFVIGVMLQIIEEVK